MYSKNKHEIKHFQICFYGNNSQGARKHTLRDTDTNVNVHYSLFMADVRQGAVERDTVADVNVEAIFSVSLVNLVGFRKGERLPLFTITCETRATGKNIERTLVWTEGF